MLITDPGPQNPLLFLSLSIIGRIPGYSPNEKEILNQLDCIESVLEQAPPNAFKFNALINPVAVACDALMSVSAPEAKKSVDIRVAALGCLRLLMEKLSIDINSLVDIIPGILSRMIKLVTGRVDVEVEKISILALKVLIIIIRTFWDQQDSWITTTPITGSKDKDNITCTNESKSESSTDSNVRVVLKEKYRVKMDVAVSTLKPPLKSPSEAIKHLLFDLLSFHVPNYCKTSSLSRCNEILLILAGKLGKTAVCPAASQEYLKLIDWFEENDEVDNNANANLSKISLSGRVRVNNNNNNNNEEIISEKIEMLIGMFHVKIREDFKADFLVFDDIFHILKTFSQLSTTSTTMMTSPSVSINFTPEPVGLTHFDSKEQEEFDVVLDANLVEFKRFRNYSKQFYNLVYELERKLIESNPQEMCKRLLEFPIEDSSFSDVLQKIDMSARFLRTSTTITTTTVTTAVTSNTTELFEDCMKYFKIISSFERIEEAQLIHLASLNLLQSFLSNSTNNNNNNFITISAIKQHFLMILSGIVSKWLILREVSTQILKFIAQSCFKMKIEDLLEDQQIFLLDRLGAQLSLPSLYPEAPEIIAALIKFSCVKPDVIMKFTDLLVKKVKENLTVYQKHLAYCKGLLSVSIEVISLLELLSKSSDQDTADSDSDIDTEEEEEEEDFKDKNLENENLKIILEYFQIAQHFILSDSKSLRSKSVDLITIGVTAYFNLLYNPGNTKKNHEPSDLCQVIHKIWPNLIALLQDILKQHQHSNNKNNKSLFINLSQLDVLVIDSVTACLQVLTKNIPIFTRDLVVKDYWGLLKQFHMFSPNTTTTANMKSQNSSLFAVHKTLIKTLEVCVSNCKPSTEICIEIVDKYGCFYGEQQDEDSIIKELFDVINEIEPDVMWYFHSIQLGKLTEIQSKSHKLLSFNNLSLGRIRT